MTVQHSGGLHAAWLLNARLRVCCMRARVCVHWEDLKSSLVRRSAGVCGRAQQIMCMSKCVVCHHGCFLYFWVMRPSLNWTELRLGAAHLARERGGRPVTANESQISYSRSTLAVWERDAEREGERERERAEVSIYFYYPSVCLSLWTAQWQSSQIRLPIIECLDRVASSSHSCTGNVDAAGNKQASNEMRVDDEHYISHVWSFVEACEIVWVHSIE